MIATPVSAGQSWSAAPVSSSRCSPRSVSAAGLMAVEGIGPQLMNLVIPLSSQWQLALGGLGLIFIVAKHPGVRRVIS